MIPELLQAARLKLLHTHPYLASMAMDLIFIESPGLGTLAVDQYFRLYYDRKVETMWDVPKLAGVLYHEIMHLLRAHPERMCSYEQGPANLAADMEINDDLIHEFLQSNLGLKLPDNCIEPTLFGFEEGLCAEEYYELLMKNPNKIPSIGGVMPGGGKCGSCATGIPEPWEDSTERGISTAEAEIIRRQVAMDILDSVKINGNVPENLKRWAEDKLTPKVNWRNELASSVRYSLANISGAVDYSYSRISRRSNNKIIYPAMRAPIPKVAVVVDTSGSISDTMLSQALAEIHGILKTVRDIVVIPTDSEAHTCQKVFNSKQVLLQGGGGTDMGAGIAAAEALRPKPDLCIVVTDGYTPWPENRPGMKTIVVLLGSGGISPAWAKTIIIN